MPSELNREKRLIAWNGLNLYIPADWDARVSGQRHLVFEKYFQPQLQIRWENSVRQPPRYLQKRLSQFAGPKGSIIPEDSFPLEFRQLRENFGEVACYQEESIVRGGIGLCAECHTQILFQLLCTEPALLQDAGDCLATLSCHNHSESHWCIQDFRLTLPRSFILKDYTFGAGLTRLSFCSSDLFLQTCKLGPADSRLKLQSLTSILTTLTDASDLKIVTGEDNNSCAGYRSPSILKQIVFRLRRDKPFIISKIRHDTVSNRLLAVVLTCNRPIPQEIIHKICSQYEIIHEESRT